MMTSAADTPSSAWIPVGMPRPLSVDRDRAVGVEGDPDEVAMAGQRLVDRIVGDLEHHVVEARAVVGVADIHAGALADRVEALQHLDRIGAVVNGLAYLAAGAGPHPVLVLMHGLPGNEKNLDLAQAVRRAGWSVVTFNYRGSWGSPGAFRFAGNLEDARAVLAYLRDPANAAHLAIDPKRIVVAGHSMGGWVTAMTAERDPDLAGRSSSRRRTWAAGR
jgi:acetyl esterase/lipase